MKANSFITAAFLTIFSMNLYAQNERATIWLKGLSPTTEEWIPARSTFANDPLIGGYNFEQIISTTIYKPHHGVEQSATDVLDYIYNPPPYWGGAKDDILGIGHDYGGIILRKMANMDTENRISALILDGVPNQGSMAIWSMLNSSTGATISDAQQMINGANSIIDAEECENCDFVGTFSSWIEEVASIPDPYEDIAFESDMIKELTANPPTVPYAVLYGTVDELSLPQLIDSRVFNTGFFSFDDCIMNRLAELEADLQKLQWEQEIRELRQTNTNFWNGILNTIAGSISTIFPGGDKQGTVPYSSIANIVTSVLTQAKQDKIEDLENKVARLDLSQAYEKLQKCKLVQTFLSAEWEWLLTQNTNVTFEVEEVEITYDDYNECVWECEVDCGIDEAWGDGPAEGCDAYCHDICEDLIGQVTTVTQFEVVVIKEKTDGIYADGEQRLPGSVYEYHMRNTNHFEEQDPAYYPYPDTEPTYRPLIEGMTPLFEGDVSLAFKLPK